MAKELQLLGAEPTHDYMADVYDRARDRFVRFDTADGLTSPGGLTGAGVVTAVLDTGLLSRHPAIQRRLIDRVDFTGEGAEDEHGHGTVVALLLLAAAPDTSLISVKALGRSGRAAPEKLLEAFAWLEREQRVQVVNVSAGVTRPSCKGDCDVCEAVRRVARAGKHVVVAAGNLPGITACPAKASDSVYTVTALDQSNRLASYASPATLRGFTADEPIVRTSWIEETDV